MTANNKTQVKSTINQTITLDYEARVPFKPFHNRAHRRAVLVCHRRAGKTVACIFDLILKALSTKKADAQYGYVCPYKNQAKLIVWKYLMNGIKPFGRLVKIDNRDLRVTFHNGATIQLFGADDPDTLRGLYFDGIVLDEFADMRPSLYKEVIAPALSDRAGWVVFIGTPKGHNSFYHLRQHAIANPDEWFYLELKLSDTGFIPEDEIKSLKAELSKSVYAQEYECSFEAALEGSYYSDQMSVLAEDGRFCDLPHDPNLPVHCAWDLGFSDATAIWFYQLSNNQVRVIDFFQVSRTPLQDIIQHLHTLPYKFGKMYLPWDAANKNLITGKTILDDLWKAGFDCRAVARINLRDGINVVRKTLPLCWFDEHKCHIGIEALKLYQKTKNKQLGIFTEQPKHDHTSHAADSFRYLAIGLRDDELNKAQDLQQTVTIYYKGQEFVTEKQENEPLLDGVALYAMPKISLHKRRSR